MIEYKLFLLIYTIITFISYLTYVKIKYGILESISASYYKLKYKSLFTLFIWSVSIPCIIIGETPLMFFAGALLSFVGAAPAFRRDMEHDVHMAGAIGGIVLGFTSLLLDFQEYWLIAIMVLFTLYALPKRLPKKYDKEWLNGIPNHTWWIEVMAFVLIIFGLAKNCV